MQHPTVGRPNHEHGPRYAHHYLSMSKDKTNLLEELKANLDELMTKWSAIPADLEEHRYAEDKWTVKGVISHIIDTERIFAYRALRCSRHDDTPIEGFEQDYYDSNSNLDGRSLKSMINEFRLVREGNIHFYTSLINSQLDYIGTASNNPISARTAGWIILGHALHHQEILENRYL